MPDPAWLLTLAEECEAAMGPSHELDERIATAAGWERRRDIWWREPGSGFWICGVHRYTGSLDAAVSLVPRGRMWFLGHMDPSDMRFAATVSAIGDVGVPTWRGFHAVAPIAVCAAALRALAGEASDADPDH